jgi:uncharacterized protein (DUF4415 family)
MSKSKDRPLIGKDGEVRELTRKDLDRAVGFDDLPAELRSTIATRRRGPQRAPTKQLTTIRLSPKVLEHFRAGGEGWQTRIDAALMELVTSEKHPRKAPVSAVVAAHARSGRLQRTALHKTARKATRKTAAKKTSSSRSRKTKR